MNLTELRGAIADMFRDQNPTMHSLHACGRLKEAMQEREAYLVSRAREEGVSWNDIALALRRDRPVIDIIYGKPRET